MFQNLEQIFVYTHWGGGEVRSCNKQTLNVTDVDK